MKDMIDFNKFVFDLDSGNKDQLDENMLKVFGAWIQYLLEKMFKGTRVPVRVVGNRIQVDRFTSALIGEKKYMDSIKRHGLDSPMTYKQRAKSKTEREVCVQSFLVAIIHLFNLTNAVMAIHSLYISGITVAFK